MMDIQLPKAVWNNQGIRPANNPQRRLATLAHWLLTPAIDKTFIQWFETMDHPLEGQRSLQETLGKNMILFGDDIGHCMGGGWKNQRHCLGM